MFEMKATRMVMRVSPFGIVIITSLLVSPIPLQSTSASQTPSLRSDQLPSQELLDLLNGAERAVLPKGFRLRAIYSRGLDVTKASEGWVPHLYNDAASYCTIGYGHLLEKHSCDGAERIEVEAGRIVAARNGITPGEGTFILDNDLATAKYTVMTVVRNEARQTDGQFAALVDFVFNVGSKNFQKSQLLTIINRGSLDRVPAQFRRWTLAGGKQWPGLVKRREQEIALFFDGLPVPRELPPQKGESLSKVDILKGE